MHWLPDRSPATLAEALRAIAPELSGCSIVLPKLVGKDDPLWWSSSAIIGEQFVAKFAWSRCRAACSAPANIADGRQKHPPRMPPQLIANRLHNDPGQDYRTR